MLIMHVLRWLVLAAELWASWSVLYLCILSLAAILSNRNSGGARSQSAEDAGIPQASFAILVPAHNEVLVLSTLLDSLSQLDYPAAKYTVFVVADNCTDGTAALARATGWVRVYERCDETRRGKGYALNWILQRLDAEQLVYDAYVVLDADAVVVPGFLRSMNRELARGAPALQGRNTVLNVSDSPSTALRWIALTLVNHVRPLGRNMLGASASLNGTGMCLSRDLIRRFPWQSFSLGEDYQYYLNLVGHGVRVRYVPDAVVRSEMPTTFAHMRTQDIRWEGAIHGQSHWAIAWRLIREGIKHRDFVRLEAVAELLTPPLSFLATWSLLTFVASVLLWSLPGVVIGTALLCGLIFYLGTAVYIVRPSPAVRKALLYAPVFMVWKVWVFLLLCRSKKNTREWVRTKRNASS